MSHLSHFDKVVYYYFETYNINMSLIGPIFICNTCNRCYSTQHEHTCGHSIDVTGHPSHSINGNLSVNGYNTAYGYYIWSDARFKHSIELLGNSNFLDKIEPVTYKLNNDPQQRKVFGLIAQNVEQHLPEAVITNENGYKGVDYIQFIPLLIRGYQEQKEEYVLGFFIDVAE